MNTNIAIVDDGWGAIPDRDTGLVRGKIVKFSDGGYIITGSTEPANGRVLAVTGVVTVWIKWADGKPVESRVTAPGQHHPEREELPDQDQSEWPAGLNNEPADPWQDSRYLYLTDPKTAEELTFVTASWGGRRAVGDLKGQIMNMRYAHPGAIPIISLESEKWKTRFGLKPKPLFKVVDWKAGSGGGEIQPGATKPTKQIERTKPKLAAEMDDEIPF